MTSKSAGVGEEDCCAITPGTMTDARIIAADRTRFIRAIEKAPGNNVDI
jgi:hypothetical protein